MAVKFDFQQTMRQASLIDELAGDMQNQCVKKLKTVYDNIEAAWSGQSAQAYLRFVRGVEEDMAKKIKYLRDTAEFLRSAAKKMEAAEAAAKNAAQSV